MNALRHVKNKFIIFNGYKSLTEGNWHEMAAGVRTLGLATNAPNVA